jgi:hypothetical protein
MTVGHEHLFYVEKTLAQIYSRLDTYIIMHKDEFGTLHITFDSGGNKLRLFSLAPGHFKASISYSGWQKIEDSAILTKENTNSLVKKIMKTTGEVKLNDESSKLSFKVERRFNLSVFLVDESETSWNMLQISRSG